MSSSNIVQQIKDCLVDDAAYKKNRKPIIQQIANGNRQYMTALIDHLKVVLKDKKGPGYSKFIAIYFLKEAMDTKEPELVNYLKDKLLKRLGDIAKSKPKEIFGANPDERVVKNFYQLILEEIYFWSEWFGTDAKGKVTKYRTVLEDVASTCQMPKKILFFTKEKPKKPEESQFKSSSSQSSNQQKQNVIENQTKPKETMNRREEKTPAQTSSTPSGNLAINEINGVLQTIDGNKEVLMEILTSNDKPDKEMLEIMGEQFKESNKSLEQSLNSLFTMDFPEKENILNKVLEESNFTSKYISEHEKLKKGRITTDQFKTTMINALASSKGSPPLKHPEKKEEPNNKKRRPDINLETIPERPENENKFKNPSKEKKVDFEVNFNSANPDSGQMGSSQSSPFDHFQSTPALQGGQSSHAFDDFNNFGNKPQTQRHDDFANFETAPARPSNFQKDPFGTFEQAENEAPANDVFSNFNSGEPQKNDFDTFNNFDQPAPQREKRSSNRPQEFSLEEEKIAPQENFEARNQQRESITQVQEEPFSGKVQFEATDGLEGLRGKRHVKKEEEEEKVPHDGVGFDDFDDFNFDDQHANEQSGFNFDYDGGKGARAGTPHSLGSKDIFADVDSERHHEVQQKHPFDSQNQRNQLQVYAESPQTGKFGEQGGNNFSESKKPPLRSSVQNAYDQFNQRESQKQYPGEDWTIPSAQKEVNRSRAGAHESPFRGQNQSMLSASQLIAQSSVGAKFGDMESERLRMERDRILSELENVKRLYNGMKIEYDYMKRNNESTETDYTKLKQELDQLKRTKGQLSLNNEYLKSENDAFKKLRGTLMQENEGHVKLFEGMSKELTSLKEKINEYDLGDQRQRNNLRVSDLETTLKNTQLKIDSMHNLHRTIHSEFNNANAELDRLRQGNLAESRLNFSPPRQEFLTSNLGRNLDISRSYVSPPQERRSLTPPAERSRSRSRSPQIVDLLSLERPNNDPYDSGKFEHNPIDHLSLRSHELTNNLIGLNLDFQSKTNTVSQYQPYRQSVGLEGTSRYSNIGGLTEQKYTSPLMTLDRSFSPSKGTYENTAPVVINNYVSKISTTSNAFSNLLTFVPKYSDIPPLETPQPKVSPRKSENPPRLSFHSLLPSKYTSKDLETLNVEQKTKTFQSENGALLEGRKEFTTSTNSTYSKTAPSQNPAANKAAALLEKAKKLREQTSKSMVGENLEGNYTRRSVVERGSIKSPHRNEIIQNQDFMVPPPGRESYKASIEQTGQVGRRLSPERERISSEYVRIENGESGVPQNVTSYIASTPAQYQFSFPTTQEFQVNTRSTNPLATSITNFENKAGYLPEGFYQGSPVRERVINRSEVIELKPTETLRIVERVVKKSPSKKNKSPAPAYRSKHSSEHKKIFEHSNYNPSLTQTLKNELEVIKRSFEDNEADYNITRKIERGRSRSPQRITEERISSYGVSKGYSNSGKVNPLVESIRNDLEALKTAPTTGSGLNLRSGTINEEKRDFESGYSKEMSLFGDSATEKSKKFYEGKNSSPYLNFGMLGDDIRPRPSSGALGVRIAVEDAYFNNSNSKGYGFDKAPTIYTNPDGVSQFNISGKKIKPQNHRKVPFDHHLFDQFKNAIFSNQYYRDIDAFKNACLTKRATLFDGHFLQLTSTTKNEGPLGPTNEVLKTIIHYTNKSMLDISEFTVQPLERNIQYTPQIQKEFFNSKDQLKQELFIYFSEYRDIPYVINLTFKQESGYKQMDIVLPITLNKFMEVRHDVVKNTFKESWKQVKFGASTIGYGRVNAKFLINHTELNKYFENSLIDLTPPINPKNKKKYGGVFRLPDNREYYVRIAMDNSRIKFMVGSAHMQGGFEERIAQYLTFLFTV